MIRRYYKIRLDSPRMFTNRFSPLDQEETYKLNLSTVLPCKVR